MKPVHVKEALSHLDRVHLFALQNEGDRSLQHAISFLNIRSRKQTSILILSVFYNMFMLYRSTRVKSVLILNIAYFLNLFIRKRLHMLIEQKMEKA